MRALLICITLIATPVAASDLNPGTYTNEEEVYFDNDAGKVPAPWIGVRIDADHKVAWIDAYGRPVTGQALPLVQASPFVINAVLDGGRVSRLQRGRPITCWGSVPKVAKKPDGSEDWYFVSGLKLHDQGGRALFGGGDTGAPPVIIRMRNVIWPTGTNKPSLVLYVHKPENPDHAESYSWADPDAKRVGINLRWMQASCSID